MEKSGIFFTTASSAGSYVHERQDMPSLLQYAWGRVPQDFKVEIEERLAPIYSARRKRSETFELEYFMPFISQICDSDAELNEFVSIMDRTLDPVVYMDNVDDTIRGSALIQYCTDSSDNIWRLPACTVLAILEWCSAKAVINEGLPKLRIGGIPGSGKTFVRGQLQKKFNIFSLDGDVILVLDFISEMARVQGYQALWALPLCDILAIFGSDAIFRHFRFVRQFSYVGSLAAHLPINNLMNIAPSSRLDLVIILVPDFMDLRSQISARAEKQKAGLEAMGLPFERIVMSLTPTRAEYLKQTNELIQFAHLHYDKVIIMPYDYSEQAVRMICSRLSEVYNFRNFKGLNDE